MKAGRRLTAAFLTVIILLCSIPFAASAKSTYKKGDLIQFGTYPQSKVDETPALKTAAEAATWNSYDCYFSTSEEIGSITSGEWMRFADFFCDGKKYRAVTFTRYRPSNPNEPSDGAHSQQWMNTVMLNKVYYFRYEPLVWRVLDPEVGLIICENIIDSQAFLNDLKTTTNETGSLYENSTIRTWLNYDFYETAFTDVQKENIENTFLIDNFDLPDYFIDFETGTYVIKNLKVFTSVDKVFLLSEQETIGLLLHYSTLGTDYSASQGLTVSLDGDSNWWTRSEGTWGGIGTVSGQMSTEEYEVISNVDILQHNRYYNDVYYDYKTTSPTCTTVGIRPACCLRTLKDDIALSDFLFSKETTAHPPSQQIFQPSSDFVVLPAYYFPNIQGGAYYTTEYPMTIKPASINTNGVTTTYSRITGTLKDKSAIPAVKTVKLIAYKYTYDGKRKTPGVLVRDAKGSTLEEGKDYTLKYSKGRKAIGEYTVTVKLIGNYTGFKTLKFKIVPAKVTGLKATSAKKAAKLTWNPVKGATHYNVFFSTSKDGSFKKVLTTKNTTATIKKLTSGKTYYFRVNAVTKLDSGAKVKGNASAMKHVKIK